MELLIQKRLQIVHEARQLLAGFFNLLCAVRRLYVIHPHEYECQSYEQCKYSVKENKH